MKLTREAFVADEVCNAWAPLRHRQDRTNNLGNPAVCIGTFTACLICAMPGMAQLRVTPSGSEQSNVSSFIAIGTNPIDIRATAIRDAELVSAILKGSRTRRISILLDQTSPELIALTNQRNIQVRLSAGNKRGNFGKTKLQYSFILEIGKDSFQQWSGPLIWTKRAFGPTTHFFVGSGDGPGEPYRVISQTFERDFLAASTVYPMNRKVSPQ